MLFGFEDSAVDTDGGVGGVADSPDDVVDADGAEATGRRAWLYGLAGFVVGMLICALVWAAWPEDEQGLDAQDVEQAIADELDARSNEPATAAQAFNQIAPSLVVVRATATGDDSPRIGAGVVINERGDILTSLHVVADASAIELGFADGTSSSAELSSSDEALDIAVLTAQGRTGVIVPAVIGNSRTLHVGDEVFAVGNPLGLTASITAGVISGLNRNVAFEDDGDASTAEDGVTQERAIEDLIQFDAAVNQGSSGGPLLNSEGQVVGIVTALADPAGQGFFVGIGFAVPIDIAAARAADGPGQ